MSMMKLRQIEKNIYKVSVSVSALYLYSLVLIVIHYG